MYLISRSAALTLPLRDTKTKYTPQGDVEYVRPALAVQFQHAGSVPPFARDAVTRLANWGVGLGEHEDPFSRCGAIDTEVEAERQGWTAEEREFVENALRSGSSNGVEYIIVDAPKTERPWPKYDDIVGEQAAEQIAWQVDQLGLDPIVVNRYEKENAGREDVAAALEALVEQQVQDVVGVINA